MKSNVLGYWPGKRWKQARAVYDGGLSPTLTAEMRGHGNNYVYLLEDRNDTGESPRNLSKGLLGEQMQPHDCNGGGIKTQK